MLRARIFRGFTIRIIGIKFGKALNRYYLERQNMANISSFFVTYLLPILAAGQVQHRIKSSVPWGAVQKEGPREVPCRFREENEPKALNLN